MVISLSLKQHHAFKCDKDFYKQESYIREYVPITNKVIPEEVDYKLSLVKVITCRYLTSTTKTLS